jgi:hypothetical protein
VTSPNTPQTISDEVVYGYIVARHRKELTRYELDLAKRCIAGDDLTDEYPCTVEHVQTLVDEAYGVIYAGQRQFSDIQAAEILG